MIIIMKLRLQKFAFGKLFKMIFHQLPGNDESKLGFPSIMRTTVYFLHYKTDNRNVAEKLQLPPSIDIFSNRLLKVLIGILYLK